VASVWRRQTFSAAVESCTPEMSHSILSEQVPETMRVLGGAIPTSGGKSILESAYEFSRMLHGSSGTADAFYRAFVPELGSTLLPRQIELVKRCMTSEKGQVDRVGATIFPGLVKVAKGPATPGGDPPKTIHVSGCSVVGVWSLMLSHLSCKTVVRRAQVVCECAMSAPKWMNQMHGVNGVNGMLDMNGAMHGAM
jgi:hypothetical protein